MTTGEMMGVVGLLLVATAVVGWLIDKADAAAERWARKKRDDR